MVCEDHVRGKEGGGKEDPLGNRDTENEVHRKWYTGDRKPNLGHFASVFFFFNFASVFDGPST